MYGASPVPYLNQNQVPGLFNPLSQAASAQVQSPVQSFSSFIKGMGGIDGIISTLGKVQKMIGLFRQFGPMLKLFGSFGPMLGEKAATKSTAVKTSESRPRKRKRQSKPAKATKR